MFRQKIFMAHPAALAALLFVLGCFYTLTVLLGYIFVPVDWFLLSILSGAIIAFLAVNAMKANGDKTKTAVISAALLPLITIFFVISKGFASNVSGKGNEVNFCVYLAHAFATLEFCRRLSLAYIQGKMARFTVDFSYSILRVPCCLILGVSLVAVPIFNGGNGKPEDLAAVNVVKSEMSPNGLYLAEVIDGDAGFADGSTRVTVTLQKNINLLIGTLKGSTKDVYHGR